MKTKTKRFKINPKKLKWKFDKKNGEYTMSIGRDSKIEFEASIFENPSPVDKDDQWIIEIYTRDGDGGISASTLQEAKKLVLKDLETEVGYIFKELAKLI